MQPAKVAAIFWGFYERWERRFVSRWLPPNVPVVELGSSLGVVSAAICRKLTPGVKLVCVEANPRLFGVLRRSLELNGRPDAALVHAALDYENIHQETIRFSAADDNLVSRIGSQEGEHVPRVTLRELLALYGIGEFSLVADIEGAEAGVVLEDRDALRRCRCAVLELHRTTFRGRDRDVPELVEAFESTGLRLVAAHFPVYAFRR